MMRLTGPSETQQTDVIVDRAAVRTRNYLSFSLFFLFAPPHLASTVAFNFPSQSFRPYATTDQSTVTCHQGNAHSFGKYRVGLVTSLDTVEVIHILLHYVGTLSYGV